MKITINEKPIKTAPRPMTGFIATLTDEQLASSLAYRGDDTFQAGQPTGCALAALVLLTEVYEATQEKTND